MEAGPVGIPMTFARNAEICGEAEPSGSIYMVVSGMVRISKLLPDGRRQISAFHTPGDLFGFEPDEVRHFSAEAVVQTKVVAFKWQSLITASVRSGAFIRELLHVTMKGLRHTQEQLLLLGRKNALERVAAFLLEMAERSGKTGVVELAMARHDIADYLGLTLETVSRMFAELKALGVIGLDGARRVHVLDSERLVALGG
jgi:CRP/FNR family nitrogen fixation transcriptional regulator